jgi:hypothetical protein
MLALSCPLPALDACTPHRRRVSRCQPSHLLFQCTGHGLLSWQKHTNSRTLHMYLAARQLKGRLCQPPPVALTMLSEHTRCGDSTASFIATMPPMLWPTMCAASQSRCV